METFVLQVQLHHFLHQDNRVHYAQSQSQEFSQFLAPEKHNEKDQTNLYNLRDLVIELTDKRLTGKLGTCKTGDKDKVLVHLTDPRPVIGTVDPSATRTLSLPEQGM